MVDDILTPNEVLKAIDTDDGIALNKHIRQLRLDVWDAYLVEMDGWSLERFMVSR